MQQTHGFTQHGRKGYAALMGQHAAAGSQRPLAIAAALRHADTHVGRRRPIVQVAAGRIGAAARIPRCGQGIGHIAALIQVAGDPRRNILERPNGIEILNATTVLLSRPAAYTELPGHMLCMRCRLSEYVTSRHRFVYPML
ncbi:hypothetical protein G6F22_019756 [Rhizopus arrhizus]|nr:hypothetical protein G6F22_019756 [Rhizopus arrhizus]